MTSKTNTVAGPGTTVTRSPAADTAASIGAVPTIAQSFEQAKAIRTLHAGPDRITADNRDGGVHTLDAADDTVDAVEDVTVDVGEGSDEMPGGGSSAATPSRSERVGAATADFATIRVSYGPQNMLSNAMNEARLSALSIRERRVSTGMRIPMPVMRTIADMGVGKTWAAEKLVARCAPADPDDGRRPVLLVELDTSGKQISLPRGILKELGKRGWGHGSDPEILWARAIEALKEFSVEILIFDEMNRAARRPSIGPVIGGDILDLLVRGDVAVAFLGTKEANKLFDRCPPLKDRMKAPAVMKALDWLIDDEKQTFTHFLLKMDEALVTARLIDEIADLAREDIAKPLWEVCRGRLRPLCLLLEEAVTAIHRANGAGPKLLTIDILAQAVEDLSIPAGTIEYNPFTEEDPA